MLTAAIKKEYTIDYFTRSKIENLKFPYLEFHNRIYRFS